jgi:hypothetical protein
MSAEAEYTQGYDLKSVASSISVHNQDASQIPLPTFLAERSLCLSALLSLSFVSALLLAPVVTCLANSD